MSSKFNPPTKCPLTFLMLLDWLRNINSKVNFNEIRSSTSLRVKEASFFSCYSMNLMRRERGRREAWPRAGWRLSRLSSSAPRGSRECWRLWSPWWRDQLPSHSPASSPARRTMATRLVRRGSWSPGLQWLGKRRTPSPIPKGLENVQSAVWHRTAGS